MQHRIVASHDLGRMDAEAPASKSWSFGVHVFVFHVKPYCGSGINGKEDAHDGITDAHPPCQEVVSHEGQCSGV
jgi:hypothetical protein